MRLYWRWKSGSRGAANGFNGDPAPVSGDEPGQPAVGRTTPPWRSGRCESLRCRMPAAPRPASRDIWKSPQDGIRSVPGNSPPNLRQAPAFAQAHLHDIGISLQSGSWPINPKRPEKTQMRRSAPANVCHAAQAGIQIEPIGPSLLTADSRRQHGDLGKLSPYSGMTPNFRRRANSSSSFDDAAPGYTKCRNDSLLFDFPNMAHCELPPTATSNR
jgi:hypothetical protein